MGGDSAERAGFADACLLLWLRFQMINPMITNIVPPLTPRPAPSPIIADRGRPDSLAELVEFILTPLLVETADPELVLEVPLLWLEVGWDPIPEFEKEMAPLSPATVGVKIPDVVRAGVIIAVVLSGRDDGLTPPSMNVTVSVGQVTFGN